jgi:chromosome segregation protein
MYLKSLEMVGFKSFAEARLEFPNGVTAIVGPNGSGKSNVVDAILWVLGEQSTKTLRSEKMEDVIFNGTELRKPLGMAEVSLVISGLDQVKVDSQNGLPGQLSEYQDLMITRRLYRNGDSEYLINKTQCRLKDIRSILLDTRAGTKGHTVIAQGQIDQILNASPQDRRELIEETAGIVRYKKQKAEALRKLDATQQNLLRVRDIIAEVKKQLNSLERQARQARSYQVLQQEARTLEVQLLTNELRRLRQTIAELERELATLSGQESEQAALQARLSAELEGLKLAIADTGLVIVQRREELSHIEQRQAQALTAAEVERHKGELYEQQRQQGAEDRARLLSEHSAASEAEAALCAELTRLEEVCREREHALAELDHEMKGLVHQRVASLQEEDRGRADVLNLTVLVANTEQNLEQLTARLREICERDGRLTREREEVQSQHDTALEKQSRLTEACRGSDGLVVDLRRQHHELEQQSVATGVKLAEVEQQVSAGSEELAAVDSHLRALEGVLREDMGYGRSGNEEATALKTCQGRIRSSRGSSARRACERLVRRWPAVGIAGDCLSDGKGPRPRHLYPSGPSVDGPRAVPRLVDRHGRPTGSHRTSGRLGRHQRISQRRQGLSVRSRGVRRDARGCDGLVARAGEDRRRWRDIRHARRGARGRSRCRHGRSGELKRRSVATPAGSDGA